MTNIAIVEDEKEERDRIRGYIDRFCDNDCRAFRIDRVHSDGMDSVFRKIGCGSARGRG